MFMPVQGSAAQCKLAQMRGLFHGLLHVVNAACQSKVHACKVHDTAKASAEMSQYEQLPSEVHS
jgi:hypothetical protein